jgi:BirA family biotin operon repressor/biotin-[acetyl-CoA-carboxylase] ligase
MYEQLKAPAGYTLIHRRETGSTNDEALRLGAGHLVVAEAQTAGRGRMNRPFPSPVGGVYLSLALTPSGSLRDAYYGLRAAAAVSVCRALGPSAKIHWPCDILVGDKTVGGILCEAQDGVLVLGVGLRADLVETAPTPEVLAQDIVNHLAELSAAWPDNQSQVIQEYCDRCVTLMKHVDVVYRGMPLYGFAFAADRVGGLMVMTQESKTVVTIYTGDAVIDNDREAPAPQVPPPPRV